MFFVHGPSSQIGVLSFGPAKEDMCTVHYSVLFGMMINKSQGVD